MGAFPEPVHCHFLPYGPSAHLYECTQRYPQHRSQASGNGQGFPDTSVPPHTLYLSFPASSLPADRLLPFPWTVLESGRCRRGIGIPKGSIGEKLYEAKVYLETPDLFSWTLVIVFISVIFEKIFLRLIDEGVGMIEKR